MVLERSCAVFTIRSSNRALKTMSYEPSGPFITSVLELKLDASTMFEWQKFGQDSLDVPHYQKLLEFPNLRAQASEASTTTEVKKLPRVDDRYKKNFTSNKHVASFSTSTTGSMSSTCTLCKHPLYACPQFKTLLHDRMISISKSQTFA